MSKKKVSGFYWHVHHDILVEWCYDYDGRVSAIKETKPDNEIETRLRLLKPVKGELPIEFAKAQESYGKAQESYDKAWESSCKAQESYGKAKESYDKAWESCGKAWESYKEEIETLHAKECTDCSWDGEQIIFQNK